VKLLVVSIFYKFHKKQNLYSQFLLRSLFQMIIINFIYRFFHLNNTTGNHLITPKLLFLVLFLDLMIMFSKEHKQEIYKMYTILLENIFIHFKNIQKYLT